MIEIGLAGKPNAGKSTFFKSATLAEAEIANYPFTTIEPNVGVAHVRVDCVCRELDVYPCGNCVDGVRFIPVKLIDIAGLVPDAHKGRGLGNEFLDDLRQADAIIHVVDASGSTDEEGNEIGVGQRDPIEDVRFLENELIMWLFGILKKNWEKIVRRIQMEKRDPAKYIAEQLAGLGFDELMVRDSLREMKKTYSEFDDDSLKEFAERLMEKRFRILIAGNKADKAPEDNLRRLREVDAVTCSAIFELTLRTASKNGFIKYLPGDEDFEIIREVNEKQKRALEMIREFMKKNGGTGVQTAINRVVFEKLGYIVVYPVEDENKFTDSKGNILPDAMLVKRGTTARELAYMIHTDIGKNYIYAIDARRKIRISEDYELRNNDVIKIVSSA
ncbi:redox-regulated ATPase YchF [Geoglobus sp.]